MKTVNQLSSASPHSYVMLLAHQRNSGKVLCACQVSKVTGLTRHCITDLNHPQLDTMVTAVSSLHMVTMVTDWLCSPSSGPAIVPGL